MGVGMGMGVEVGGVRLRVRACACVCVRTKGGSRRAGGVGGAITCRSWLVHEPSPSDHFPLHSGSAKKPRSRISRPAGGIICPAVTTQ